jgi:putative PIN family toxin of toxin-antitoxin system
MHATFAAVADGRVALCVSPALLAEVKGVLGRQDVRKQFPALTPSAVSTFLADVRARTQLFDPVPRAFTLPGHPDDDHLFDLAIHARARYLVTWESRLLALAAGTDPAADQLRRLAPDLAIVTPVELAGILRGPPVP